MSRFDGTIRIGAGGGPDQLKIEFDATMDQFLGLGFTAPADLTTKALLLGAGKPFVPEEMPTADRLLDVGEATKHYFGKVVQPELKARSLDKVVIQFAHQIGRLASAADTAGSWQLPEDRPFTLEDGIMRADGTVSNYRMDSGLVVDLGMGMTGLLTHLKNVRSGEYTVAALQKEPAEKEFLNGAAEQKQVADRVTIFDGGITKGISLLSGSPIAGSFDMVVASRVHNAGRDLEQGSKQVSKLLRPDGIFVGRGPRKYPPGTNYDKIAHIFAQDRNMAVTTNELFDQFTRTGAREPNRLVIAYRK